MSLMWMIYFIDVICGDWFGLGFVLGIVFLFGCVLSIIKCVALASENPDKDEEDFLRFAERFPLKTMITVPLTISFLSSFIPSQDTAYKMLAAYGVEEIVSNEKVQELGGKSLEVLEKAMDEYLAKDKPKGND